MKAILASLALATLSLGAFATEATQFTDAPASALSRAEIQASHLAQPLAHNIGEATVFADPAGSAVSRAEVRAQAVASTLARIAPGATYGEASVFSRM
jgi:hypothetical protein